MLPPDYDGARSWSKAALPYYNPCFDTASTVNDSSCRPPLSSGPVAVVGVGGIVPKCDGGLPCVFCPVDVESKLHLVNTSVANEFCELDASEDTKSVKQAVVRLGEQTARWACFVPGGGGLPATTEFEEQGAGLRLSWPAHKPKADRRLSALFFAVCCVLCAVCFVCVGGGRRC